MMPLPLDGMRVIDWTHVLAGPACSYYLGLLGAEVIKVESLTGDAMRHRGGTDAALAAAGMSTAYQTQGAGKQSIALDLETDAGRAVFHRLLTSADVLVENHRPSTLAHLDLSETQTRAINPRLIHCAMTGYGRGNAMADVPAYDVNIQAISGLMALTGTDESGPIRTGAPIVDYATGLAGALAVTAALMQRHTTGEGAFVDVSMLETAFSLMSSTITDYQMTGTPPKPRGNAANSRSPSSGTFACLSGHISLGVNEDAQFRRMATALGRADWLDNPKFATAVARDQNQALLAEELVAVLVTQSAEHWEEVLIAAQVPAARLRTLPEALALAPATTRKFASRGPANGVGIPFAIAGEATAKHTDTPPSLGCDSESVLRDLGYSEDEVDALRQNGVIAAPPK
ncbi:CaiB/BaiF CoA transferase family protein [Roseobacter sp. CCS2]|uniref:CaiB/BaiF CoA transferase family protein n=1 Tax=Roseobacter sp. CCS2 TaxID=391593 RepID=UPI0000F3F810|nr:CoA transferase [Roseobacter sp. CCS2]EBA10773.1 L-carnitine dehydratase/bile acid-inducible protein F [Roseobacter sp. CCS2]